ncbi:MAG TPA: iron-containing alcohol dehydrogenase [Candidatus Aminicenantes bacterium]|mgnify:CR=1 FL=1|nr:iron-containing alcohol dehydrogenase [Candidatus Aminicenantes bacterium]
MDAFDFHLPTRIVFGRGRAAGLGGLLPAGAEKVLVVTDGTIARKTPILRRVVDALAGREVAVYDRVEENPSVETAEEAGREARRLGAGLVVGLGGGSPMDAAKGAALLAANPGPLREYLAGKRPTAAPLPVVAVPTTSGTGSETTPFAVFTDRAAGQKTGYGNPGIFPALALIDPELSASMPAPVVVDTGLDVLAHGVEAYLSTASFPLNDALALEAVGVAVAELPRAAKKEPEAMDRMAAAAAAAGAAIAHASTILPHIMGYPLTLHHGVPHGRASAVMLVHVLAALRESSSCPRKVETVTRVFEARGGLEGFLRELGVSARLSDYGVRDDEIGLFAAKTILKGDVRITPAAVTVESLERIYRSGLR